MGRRFKDISIEENDFDATVCELMKDSIAFFGVGIHAFTVTEDDEILVIPAGSLGISRSMVDEFLERIS